MWKLHNMATWCTVLWTSDWHCINYQLCITHNTISYFVATKILFQFPILTDKWEFLSITLLDCVKKLNALNILPLALWWNLIHVISLHGEWHASGWIWQKSRIYGKVSDRFWMSGNRYSSINWLVLCWLHLASAPCLNFYNGHRDWGRHVCRQMIKTTGGCADASSETDLTIDGQKLCPGEICPECFPDDRGICG